MLIKNNVRHSKFDPLVEEVMLIESNPQYALICHKDGKESTVSNRQLAPPGDSSLEIEETTNQIPSDQTIPLKPIENPSESFSDEINNSVSYPQETENIASVEPPQINQPCDLGNHEITLKQGKTHPYNLRSREV